MSIRLQLCLLIICAVLLPGCRQKIDMQFLEKLVHMAHPQYKNKPVPEDILEETSAIVKKYKDDLSLYGDKVKKLSDLYRNIGQKYLDIGYFQQQIPAYLAELDAEKQISDEKEETIYNQALGILLMQKGLYARAYEFFGKALEISLDSELLYYYCGLCTATIAKAEKIAGTPQAGEWFGKSEKYYLQALKIDPDYVEALYGLSIVLVYELDKPGEALPYLLRIKEKRKDNVDALFVLANVYYQLGMYKEAILEYETIENTTKIESTKAQARGNKERIQKIYADGEAGN